MTLQEYLAEKYPGIPITTADKLFAAEVRSTRASIGRYRQFKRNPSPTMVARMRDASGGLVTAEDHLPPHLRAPERVSA